jgi:hypothetical protein
MVTENIKYQVGTLKKPLHKMSDLEIKEWEKTLAKNAREYLFSIGQCWVYTREDGKVVEEDKDGNIKLLYP